MEPRPRSVTCLRRPLTSARVLAAVLLSAVQGLLSFIVTHAAVCGGAAALLAAAARLLSSPPPGLEGLCAAVTEHGAFVAYWVTLGVLSSVGLGSGLHTFVLFLGPHIVRVANAAVRNGSTGASGERGCLRERGWA